MDNTQNQLNTGGSNLNQTDNPQAVSNQNQNLTAQQNNLQTSSSDLLNQTGLKIVAIPAAKTQTPAQTAALTPSNTSVLPVIVAFVIGIAILTSLVILAVKKGQSPQE